MASGHRKNILFSVGLKGIFLPAKLCIKTALLTLQSSLIIVSFAKGSICAYPVSLNDADGKQMFCLSVPALCSMYLDKSRETIQQNHSQFILSVEVTIISHTSGLCSLTPRLSVHLSDS